MAPLHSLSLSSSSVVRRSFGVLIQRPARVLAPRPVGLRYFGPAAPVAPVVPVAPYSPTASQKSEGPEPDQEQQAAAMWANRVTALVRLLARD